MATSKRPTMLRLREEAYNKIHAIADIEHRSMNMQIEYILDSYIKDYEASHGPLLSEGSE